SSSNLWSSASQRSRVMVIVSPAPFDAGALGALGGGGAAGGWKSGPDAVDRRWLPGSMTPDGGASGFFASPPHPAAPIPINAASHECERISRELTPSDCVAELGMMSHANPDAAPILPGPEFVQGRDVHREILRSGWIV